MSVIFENILTKERVSVSRENHGDLARSVAAAYVNSSDLSVNRQEDYGWRLIPEQMAQVRKWMADPEMVATISDRYKIPAEDLQVYDFVNHLIQTQMADPKGKMGEAEDIRAAEAAYNERIAALVEGTPVEVPEVKAADIPTEAKLSKRK